MATYFFTHKYSEQVLIPIEHDDLITLHHLYIFLMQVHIFLRILFRTVDFYKTAIYTVASIVSSWTT